MIKKRMIITLICFMLGGMLITACRKTDNENPENTSETTAVPTVTPSQTAEDTKEETDETDTTEQTGTEEGSISQEKAIREIQDIIGERGYYFELLENNLGIEDDIYYVYQVSDSDGPIKPNILVNKVNGVLLCYNTDGSTSPFSEHPLYTEPDSEGTDESVTEEKFTKEDALAQLSKVSAKDLELPVELAEYTIFFDDWTTNIKGTDCYGINVYCDVGDKMINMGLFYVATDGSVFYKFDSILDDFAEIKEQ